MCIYAIEYYSTTRIHKEDIPPFTTWIEFMGIILSEIRQIEKDK